ncbi:MAG: ribonuclease P protein component [Candidatus Omnitrophota bacterium]
MSEHSFGKACRLKKSFEFRRVREKGTLSRGKIFSLCFMKNGLDCHRLGLSISSSAVPLASSRTRVKRIIRETFRTSRDRMKSGPYDIVVYIKRRHSGAIGPEAAKKDLIFLMERAKG